MNHQAVTRNVLLNPGPATTTDSVKYAQVVPDICPREREFSLVMQQLSMDLVRVVHGDPDRYVAVLFCGSGTVCIDACISSLVPDRKRILIVNNGAYSQRAVEVCQYYHIDHIVLQMPIDRPADVSRIEDALSRDNSIAVVYACHHETGTGVLNPVKDIGATAHRHNAVFVVDTTSSYAMVPIDIEADGLDIIMASAQKGLMAMTGLSFVIGRKALIEASREYTPRSYYTNLFRQYHHFARTGEMHFTPPVQTIYAARQAMKEYWEEGEQRKWERHQRVWNAIWRRLNGLGFRLSIAPENQSRLVVSVLHPKDPNWDFDKIHDYCYRRGFTIYPGKIFGSATFRLCAYGAIDEPDVYQFFVVFEQALRYFDVAIPVEY